MSYLWAAQWHSKTVIDGDVRYILYEDYLPKLFRTRQVCRDWIRSTYGYILSRPDLRTEPYGWRLPRAVKVSIEVKK